MWISPPFYFQFRCFSFLIRLCEVQTRLQVLLMMILDADAHVPNQKQNKKEKKSEAVNKRERDWKRLSKLNGLLCMRGPALSPLTKIIHESRNKVHSTSIIFQKVTNRTKKKKNHLGDYVEMLISLHGDYVLPMDLKVRLVSVPSRRWKTFNESSSWLGSHTPPKPKK